MGILDDLKHKAEELGDKAKEGLEAARDKAGDLVGDVRERLGQHDSEQAPLGESEDVAPDTSSTAAVQPDYVTGEDAASGTGVEEGSLGEDDAIGVLDGDTETDGDLTDEETALGEGVTSDAVLGAGAVTDGNLAEGDLADEETAVGEDLSSDAVLGAGTAPSSDLDEGTSEDQGSTLDPVATTETDAPDPVDPAGSPEPADAVGSAEVTDSSDEVGPSGAAGSDADASQPADDAGEPLVETDVDPYAEPLTQTIGEEIALDPVDSEAVAEAVEDASSERDS